MARPMTEHPESEPYRLATSASHLLHRAEQLAATRFTQLVNEAVTLRQFAVLTGVAEQPGLSQSDLVRATGIDRSTLADMMKALEKRGLVVRTPSTADGRAYSVRLSQSGAAILSAATQHARAADAAILDLLPRTKRKSFLATLTKLAKLSAELAEKAERVAKREQKKQAKLAREKAKTDKAKAEKAARKPRR
ncbi:MAG: MarR family transcriptional regulator [Hyphomonadaceae bacterium]|nr:MarR family transcriptional regulator [Hyphomonadaceae bacterium]